MSSQQRGLESKHQWNHGAYQATNRIMVEHGKNLELIPGMLDSQCLGSLAIVLGVGQALRVELPAAADVF